MLKISLHFKKFIREFLGLRMRNFQDTYDIYMNSNI